MRVTLKFIIIVSLVFHFWLFISDNIEMRHFLSMFSTFVLIHEYFRNRTKTEKVDDFVHNLDYLFTYNEYPDLPEQIYKTDCKYYNENIYLKCAVHPIDGNCDKCNDFEK